jgi:glycosyltransferase involved in cell wall biosynthesis
MKRPDLVITTHVNFAPAAQWLHLALGVPYMAVAHGVDVWGSAGEPLRRPLNAATRVLAVSRHTRDRMLSELALEPEKVGVLPNTFDPEMFQPGPKPRYLLKRHGIEADDPVILTVCRLANAERYKGYDQLLEVLPSVLRTVPKARYVIAGRGPDRPRVESIVRRLGLSERVVFAGYVPDYELPDYYNLCDVFAMPSKGEGFGIVFLEALASGKPVLAGNVDGSVDALLGGELGILIDPDDPSQLRDALIQVLERRHPLDIMWEPQRLRARAIQSFGFSRFVKTVAWHLSVLGFEAGVVPAPPVTATI